MNNPLLNKLNKDLKFVYSDNNSLSVIFHDNDLLIGVVGEFNKNLKELEKITESSLFSRGNSILIKSNPQKNEIIKNAIQFLAKQFINNGSIENKDIQPGLDGKFDINEIKKAMEARGGNFKVAGGVDGQEDLFKGIEDNLGEANFIEDI